MGTFYRTRCGCWIFLTALLLQTGCGSENQKNDSSWAARGGSPDQIRYSSLSQIDTTNISELQVAWTYHTLDPDDRTTQIQTNPIVIDSLLFGISPGLKVFALDAATGEEKWTFNPFKNDESSPFNISRGVAWWQGDGEQRILFSAGSWLYALNALDGSLMQDFGENGRISLKEGFDESFRDYFAIATSPGVVYKDLIVIGSRVSEGADAAPGDIRAFHVKTGELVWTFYTIPRPGEFGHDTWEDPDAWRYSGGANSWAGMALDEDRGIVYVPTGSASPDFYGGGRKGANLFANSLLALDAATGERIWHFQTVYHDLWDRDLPSPPSLVTVNHNGREIDAVAQTTKTGFVYLFDRENGAPLFDIVEREVPTETGLEGEEVWPRQPFPVKPAPLMRQEMGPDDINPFISENEQEIIREKLLGLSSDHIFAPPSLQGTLMFPGFDGGAEWGGSAFDPQTGILYVNTNEVPWILQMIDRQPDAENSGMERSIAAGRNSYMANCVACHGTDLQGSGRSPALTHITDRLTPEEISEIINSGNGMMPAFAHLPEAQKKAIVNFLTEEVYYDIGEQEFSDKQEFTGDSETSERYILNGYQKFRTEEGYPANSPPWGRLNAVDLNTGEIAWQVPLGEYPELSSRGIPATGTENYGGPVVTKGGLVFIAGTPDKKIRAFHKRTGELLWEDELPYAGYATPAVYEMQGNQYLVIACGGGKLGSESGDVYVAYSLGGM